MTTYTIDTDNSITAHGNKLEAGDGATFTSKDELAKLVAEWPTSRLIEVWNGIPGLTRIKKFTDRKSGVARIWKAIQSLDGGAAEGAPTVTTAITKAKAAPKQAKKTTAKSTATAAKRKRGVRKPAVARDGSKKAEVLALLEQKGGATLEQIMRATGWQAHSVRGFISGALGKKMGLKVASERRPNGVRVYSIS